MSSDPNYSFGHAHPVNMGLGDIIRRLMHIEWQGRHTGLSHEIRSERDLLLEALNAVPVTIGFDCNADGDLDHGVGIFLQAASTSCCRISAPDSSRYTPPTEDSEQAPVQVRGSTSRASYQNDESTTNKSKTKKSKKGLLGMLLNDDKGD